VRSFRALGFVFGLRAPDPHLDRFAARVLDPLAVDEEPAVVYDLGAAADDGSDGSGPTWELRRGCESVARSTEVGDVLGALFVDINRHVLAASSGAMLIHAAAAAADGRGLVFPAASGSGKTTLVAGLVQAGLDYLTDEITAISLADGRIQAFPKALSVKAGAKALLARFDPTGGDFDPLPEWHLDPRAIRADAMVESAQPAFVIAPTYVPGSTSSLVAIPRSQAVFLLAQHSFNLADHGRAGLEALAQVVRGCDCYRLVVGRLDAACDLVCGLVDEPDRSLVSP
jgi:hypothetical protein